MRAHGTEEETRERGSSKRAGKADSSIHMRYRFASLLRMSDGLVGRAVSAYDNLFELNSNEQAEIYMQIGREAAREGKTLDAQAAFRQVLELRSDDGEAWLELGLIQLRREAPAAAVECFEKAAELNLVSFELSFYLAEALNDLGRTEQAVAQYQKALEIQPDSPEALFHMGVLLDALGRLDDAVVAFERAVELSPKDATYHQSLGFTLESMGRRDEAIACFKRALHLERRRPAVR